MEYMTTSEAEEKWNISERRIRQLLTEGRIEGAIKIGGNWNIPIEAEKPLDKRILKPDNNDFIINLDANYFDEVDKLKTELDSKRPIPKETLKSLKESINLEWTYNSNGIEGNTLTLRETQVVLEGITIGGKSIKEHLEAINHERAIIYLEDLVKDGIKNIPAYIPGDTAESVEKKYGIAPEDILKLASNENQFGPSPKAIEAMAKEVGRVHIYPDPFCIEIRKKIGVMNGFDDSGDNVVIAVGASGILSLLGEVFIKKDWNGLNSN